MKTRIAEEVAAYNASLPQIDPSHPMTVEVVSDFIPWFGEHWEVRVSVAGRVFKSVDSMKAKEKAETLAAAVREAIGMPVDP